MYDKTQRRQHVPFASLAPQAAAGPERTRMIPIGTITNALAVIGGSLAGAVLGRRFPARVREMTFQGLGLVVLVIGLKMGLTFQRPLLIVFSMLIGAVAGELLGVEDFLNSLGDRLKKRLGSQDARFTEGFVTASLIYCIGSMAIIGAFDEGLRGDPSVLFTKAVLDGFTSIALASTYGLGVLFSAVPVFVYQYGLTLFALAFKTVVPPVMIQELTALGGLLIVGIGINLLGLMRIRIGNLLPSLPVLVVLVLLFV